MLLEIYCTHLQCQIIYERTCFNKLLCVICRSYTLNGNNKLHYYVLLYFGLQAIPCVRAIPLAMFFSCKHKNVVWFSICLQMYFSTMVKKGSLKISNSRCFSKRSKLDTCLYKSKQMGCQQPKIIGEKEKLPTSAP